MNRILIAALQSPPPHTEARSPKRVWWGIVFAALCAVVPALWPSWRAQAADIVYNRTIPLTLTDSNASITVPKFSSELGTLVSVEISFSSKLKGSAQFESLDQGPALVTTLMDGQLNLLDQEGAPLTSAHPSTSRSIKLRPYDGVMDFDGPSGGAFNQMLTADLSNTKVLSTAEELEPFIGTGSLSMTMVTQASVAGSGGGNLALNYATQASAVVTVKYSYQNLVNPAIDLEKYTNGDDADLPTGPLIEVGKPVTWTYVIQNTGDTPLVNLKLVDDPEGIITCPQKTLAISEQITCMATGIAALGQYTNTATVTADTPKDPLVPTQTVTDSDPSHYYGIPQTALCPTDEGGVLVLPTVTFLGEGGGPYTLPAGFDTFIVKRLTPFHFVTDPGVDSNGQKIYTLQNANERVYACAGACQFTQALKTLVGIGHFGSGVTIGAVVIDDDNDQRINSWVANGDTANPYQKINLQTMVENLVLDIPFEADWSFNAIDSVGLVHVCVAPTTSVRSASIVGEGVAEAQAAELNEPFFEHQVFLPITRSE